MWCIMKSFEFIYEEIEWYLHIYNLFLLRHCDEANEIKNTETRRILGFKDN